MAEKDNEKIKEILEMMDTLNQKINEQTYDENTLHRMLTKIDKLRIDLMTFTQGS